MFIENAHGGLLNTDVVCGLAKLCKIAIIAKMILLGIVACYKSLVNPQDKFIKGVHYDSKRTRTIEMPRSLRNPIEICEKSCYTTEKYRKQDVGRV